MNLGLPGEIAHAEMSPMKRPSGNFPERTQARLSAVAVVIAQVDDGLSVILTQRNEYDGAHSGQISFPGGKKENDDDDLEHTARRECLEEIGLQLNRDTLIGGLTDVYIPVSRFIVQPYVYFHENVMEIRRDEREVREVIPLPIDFLCSEHAKSTMDVRSKEGLIYRNVPCFRRNDKEIWGATALILNELRYLLLR